MDDFDLLERREPDTPNGPLRSRSSQWLSGDTVTPATSGRRLRGDGFPLAAATMPAAARQLLSFMTMRTSSTPDKRMHEAPAMPPIGDRGGGCATDECIRTGELTMTGDLSAELRAPAARLGIGAVTARVGSPVRLSK